MQAIPKIIKDVLMRVVLKTMAERVVILRKIFF